MVLIPSNKTNNLIQNNIIKLGIKPTSLNKKTLISIFIFFNRLIICIFISVQLSFKKCNDILIWSALIRWI